MFRFYSPCVRYPSVKRSDISEYPEITQFLINGRPRPWMFVRAWIVGSCLERVHNRCVLNRVIGNYLRCKIK